jgi:methionyl-tRNA synthetase
MEFARECNRYVDERAPWKTRKTDLERTISTITHSLWAIKALGVMLSPFMPTTGDKILNMLSINTQQTTWDSALEPLIAGSLIEEPQILFTKIEQEISA